MSILLAKTSAAAESELTRIVWQWPTTPLGWALLVGGFGAAAAAIVWFQRRDVREQPAFLRFLLPTLRLAALAALLVIFLAPQRRTTREAFQPSRVSILVDTSGSMQQPAVNPSEVTADSPSRSEAVRRLLDESELIDELRQRHAVSVYTFGDSLSETPIQLPYQGPMAIDRSADETDGETEADQTGVAIDWAELTEPVAGATRLGDAVEQLLARRSAGRDVGVVLLSDGALNAGQGVRTANSQAIRDDIRLVAVGFGGTERAINVSVTRLIGPTDVQAGDAFTLTGYVQGVGVAGKTADIRLVRSTAQSSETEVLETKTVTLPDDGQPLAVSFDDRRTGEGEFDYTVKAVLREKESRDDDNAASRTVRIFDRPFNVLMIAGGPGRDYRFARNALFRHPSAEIDVWLQSGRPGISQESRELLFEFPTTREAFFQYDVVIAFDPDWAKLTDEQIGWLLEWVGNEGGGLIAQIGDVFTPQLAGVEERLEPIRTLYPVQLEPVRLSLTSSRSRNRVFPFTLTDAGLAADFLEVDDDGDDSVGIWERFEGVYNAYPTSAIKSGATVYAEFPNPLIRGASGTPPLVAEQRYAQGTVLYLGTGELWRLRSVDEDVYDRLWVKLVRRAGQGRSRQGVQRAVWLLDGRQQPLGQSTPIRARVVSSQFTPLDEAELPIAIRTPSGQVVSSELRLTQDPRRPTEYAGEFRPLEAGRYELNLTPPGDTVAVTGELRVELPQLEASKLEQDRKTLMRLVEETGGGYLSPDEAAAAIPELLPTGGQSVQVDRQLNDLWDRWWVLAGLIGLLGLEWLIRKFVALA